MPLFSSTFRSLRSFRPLALLCAGVVVLGLPAAAWGDPETDRRIERAARSSYNFRAVLDQGLEVKSEEGVVTLRGVVRDPQQKALAEATVRELPGVQSVKNELEAAAPLHERADGWIKLKIRSLLFLRSEVSGRHTDVEVHEGVVTLSGVAESDEQRDLTEALARGVQGVRDVRNELQIGGVVRDDPLPAGTPAPAQPLAEVAPSSAPMPPVASLAPAAAVDDDLLAVHVSHALAEEGAGDVGRTQVESRRGQVLIRGLARSEQEKARASQLARGVPGVAAVINEMSVGAAE